LETRSRRCGPIQRLVGVTGSPKSRAVNAVMCYSRRGEAIIPGCRNFEWVGFIDRRGEEGQRGQQTRESPANFPVLKTLCRRFRCSFGFVGGKRVRGFSAQALRGGEGENLRGQNPKRALAERFGVTTERICVALYRELISGMLGHF
jgi:hypothetical protein